MRRWLPRSLALALLALIAFAIVVALSIRDDGHDDASQPSAADDMQIERGAYLARAGNCVGCHTRRGGPPYAGGRAIETPFGTVYGSNLTPDERTGIGRWSAADFWRALHNGRSRDGRLLVPAFPYPDFTLVTRDDADAIFAFLRTLAPVAQENRAHDLRFPFGSQPALAVWRALFFTPGTFRPDPTRSAEWNRGSYLVRGLGHCSACHGGRNLFGASSGMLSLSGGVSPVDKWYAPALTATDEAGLAEWDSRHVVQLLQTGVAPEGSALGPMAEVVYRSTQHLNEADLRAMAVFLKSLPATSSPLLPLPPPDGAVMARGENVYREHCEDCHGPGGEGARNAYPALANNRSVVMQQPTNVIRAVLSGGFQPATAGNPRPWGMPPFGHVLDDQEVAAVVTYIRNRWGNRAEGVSAADAQRLR